MNGTENGNSKRTRKFSNEVELETAFVQDNPLVKQKMVLANQKKDEILGDASERGTNSGNENASVDEVQEGMPREENANATNESEGAQGEKVEKRGRHKLECTCEKCTAKREGKPAGEQTQAKPRKDGSASLDSATSAYKKVAAPVQGSPQDPKKDYVDLSQYISGALLLIAIDSVMPSLMCTVLSWFMGSKYKYADKKLLKLTPTEKKELEPLADQIVKLLFGMVHPAVAFAVTLGIMYAGKIMSLEDSDFKIPPPKLKQAVSTNERRAKK